MDIFVGVIVGLLVLMLLVTAHEFGHFLAARRNGVRVLEFGICFPPKAIAWVKDPKTKKWKRLPRKDWKKPQEGLIFSLNWLPIGGFCQMDGESAEDDRSGTFGHASYWSKTKILFAGVTMNWLVAFIIFTILAWTGMPEFIDNQFTVPTDTVTERTHVKVETVAENSPAERAGLKSGDYIVSVDGNEFYHASEITDYNSAHAGETVEYRILKMYQEVSTPQCLGCETSTHEYYIDETHNITLNPADSEYLLGVTLSSAQAISHSTWSAPIVGAGLTLQLTGETFKGVGIVIGDLISGIARQFSPNPEIREDGQAALSAVGDSVSGPVGIIGQLFPAFTSAGPSNLAFLAAIISISLACMNVLPIPALDGGRWFLITLYKLRHKKLTKATEEKIVSRAFVVLLALIFIVTILDIVRLTR